MGKGSFTADPAQVDESKGRFLLIDQDDLTKFLMQHAVANRFLRRYCLPFFREYSLKECSNMINNLKSIDKSLASDTDWLAVRLSGGTGLAPGMERDGEEEARDLVIKVHNATPSKAIVKDYLINKNNDIPGAAMSTKGRRTKIQVFQEAVDKSPLKLFRFVEAGCFQKLLVDWSKLSTLMAEHGGADSFGDAAEWGDSFAFRDEQTDCSEEISTGLYKLTEDSSNNANLMEEAVRETKMVLRETADVTALRAYAAQNTDRRPQVLAAYVDRLVRDGRRQPDGRVEIEISYYQSDHYGRLFSKGASGQKLTKEARRVAFSGFYGEFDAGCCHPRLMLKLLRDLELDSEDTFPMLHRYCANFNDWRAVLQAYSATSADEAKVSLTKLFYGGKPGCDIPFLRKLCAEIQTGVQKILSTDKYQSTNQLFASRKKPVFSRLASILSFCENEMLVRVVSDIKATGNLNIVLLFDGALVQCLDAADVVTMCAAAHSEYDVSGMRLSCKSIPNDRMPAMLRQLLLVDKGSVRKDGIDEVMLDAVLHLNDLDAFSGIAGFNDDMLHSSQRNPQRIPQIKLVDSPDPATFPHDFVYMLSVTNLPGGAKDWHGFCFSGHEVSVYSDILGSARVVCEWDVLSGAFSTTDNVEWYSVTMHAVTDIDALGAGPAPKAAKKTCAAEPECKSHAEHICCRCQKPCCSKHGYMNEFGVLLACKPCGGQYPPHWASLEAEWQAMQEDKEAEGLHGDMLKGEDALGRAGGSSQTFRDTCLVDALRNLGIPVVPSRDGPFWAVKDGNEMVEPFGLTVRPVGVQQALEKGNFILYKNGHFTAMVNTGIEMIFKDGSDVQRHDIELPRVAAVCVAAYAVDSSASGLDSGCNDSIGGAKEYVTPRKKCFCGCSLSVAYTVEAKVVTMTGIDDVSHILKRCCGKSCRAYFGHNYTRAGNTDESGSRAYNAVKLDEVSVLFVTRNFGFSLQYLQYHDALQFRGFVSARCIAWCMDEALLGGAEDAGAAFRRSFSFARNLYLAMLEFGEMEGSGYGDYLYSLRVQDSHDQRPCFTDAMLKHYDRWLHECSFPPNHPEVVKELAGDGHEKVAMKVCGAEQPMKMPRGKHGQVRHTTNGWFMITDPATGRILSVEQQIEPENNAVVEAALGKVLPLYPQVDTFIMDRNCKFAPTAGKAAKFRCIKFWCIDKFHAVKHSKKCVCNPNVHTRLERRLRGVNTSISEQVVVDALLALDPLWFWLWNRCHRPFGEARLQCISM
jgi:hypothetical protein